MTPATRRPERRLRHLQRRQRRVATPLRASAHARRRNGADGSRTGKRVSSHRRPRRGSGAQRAPHRRAGNAYMWLNFFAGGGEAPKTEPTGGRGRPERARPPRESDRQARRSQDIERRHSGLTKTSGAVYEASAISSSASPARSGLAPCRLGCGQTLVAPVRLCAPLVVSPQTHDPLGRVAGPPCLVSEGA
eukprot:scaffold111_cov404-Prasinococcus_capsulatus_cf.AAC.7